MYYAMDDIGLDHIDPVRRLRDAAEKWHYIDNLAREARFDGIHITRDFYQKELHLPLDTIPEHIRRYRLTYHLGGTYSLMTDEEYGRVGLAIDNALEFARGNGIEDVSIHPPRVPVGMQPMRGFLRGRFFDLLEAHAPRYRWAGITLSVESHIYSPLFVFQGLADYADFILELDRIGALIDISHNCYQGYSEYDLLDIIRSLPVTGLHISDANPRIEDVRQGTHLPIGGGIVGIRRILSEYEKAGNVYGAFEIKTPFVDIIDSVQRVRAFW